MSRVPLMAVLGIGLVVLLGATWGTGILYLVARAGLPSPVRLAVVDGIHIYTGLAALVFFGVKVWRVGFRRRVRGVPNLTAWQRWVSWSLLALYPAIFITGLVAVLPLGAAAKAAMVQAHLMTSVWSLLPTTLHLLHHRRRATGQLRSRPRPLTVGLGCALLPALLFVPWPRAASPAAEGGLGGAWTRAGLQGVSIDRISVGPGGRYLVAAGDGIYASDASGRAWHHLDLGGYAAGAHTVSDPSPPSAAAPALASLVVAHPGHVAAAGEISTLTTAPGPVAIYAGSSAGLYTTPDAATALAQDHFGGGEVRAVAVDPANAYERWVASSSGIWFTWVFGHGWTNESAGLRNPAGASAVVFFRGQVYASDLTAIYRWDTATSSWTAVLREIGVTSLSATSDVLLAASYSRGLIAYDGSAWRVLGSALQGHTHSGVAVHEALVSAPAAGGLLVVQPGRVGYSTDGGRSWSRLGSGLPDATRDATRLGDRIFVATADGLYAYDLTPAPQDSPAWWALLLATAALAGAAGIVLASGRSAQQPFLPVAAPTSSVAVTVRPLTTTLPV